MTRAIDDSRVQRGMRAQLELRRRRFEAGDAHLGWKIGFGTPAAMERLGIEAPLIGFLTRDAVLPSASTVSIAGWTRPALEPEIAVYLGSDLGAAPDREQVRAAVAALGPAFELADVDPPPEEVEAILAGNIFNRAVILGRRDPSRAGLAVEGLVGRVYRQGEEAAVADDPQAQTGDLIEVLRHAAGLLAALGEGLRAGDVIITGSIVAPIPLEGEEEVRFVLEPMGEIDVRMTPRPG